MMGSIWLTKMFEPDSAGYVEISGGDEGGHEWLALWYEERKERYVCQNSWGTEWGLDGLFYVRRPDMKALLEDLAGDAVTAVEVKLPKATR